MCKYMLGVHKHVGTCRVQKRALGPQELELKAV